MKKLLLICGLLWSALASAQFVPGQVLTAAELNSAFSQYAPLTGATFSGPLTVPSIASVAPIPLSSGGTGANTALGATSQFQFQQPLTSSVARTVADKLGDAVNILDFVNASDRADLALTSPTKDYTYAMTAAVSALPAGGGTIVIPNSVPILPLNYVLTKSGVTIRGMGQTNWLYTATAYTGMVPYNSSLPVLQVGNDTGYVVGTDLENLSISNPSGTGNIGLKLYGGTLGFVANGLTVTGFNQKSVWLQNSPNFPVSYVHINHYTFNTNSNAAAVTSGSASFYAEYDNSTAGPNTSFTTGISLQDGNLPAANNVAHQLWLDGVQMWMGNTYIQCSGPDTGIMLAQTWAGAPLPEITWANGSLDAGSFSTVAIEAPFTTESIYQLFVNGTFNFHGSYSYNGGVVQSPGTDQSSRYLSVVQPLVMYQMTFPTPGTPFDASANIQGTGAAGSRQLVFTGIANLNSGAVITGTESVSGAATFNGTAAFNSTSTFAGVPTFSAAPTISYTGASIYLNDSSGSSSATLRYQSAGTNTWSLGASGSNYSLNRYVSGVLTDTPIQVNKNTGVVAFADGITVQGTVVQGNLTGTTGSIGGSALAAGACATGTVAITGATTSMAVLATPVTYPGAGYQWNDAYVSSAGTVTVPVCAIAAGTPTASAYNVRVLQ